MEEAVRRRRHILGIDLLRVVAACLVAIYHFGFCSWANPSSPFRGLPGDFTAFVPFHNLVDYGWVGVQIFFVISGLVIASSAENSNALAFAKNRFLRLAPGVWVCASITAVVLLAEWGPSRLLAREYVDSIDFFPAEPWVSSVYWTLAVEIVFYAVVFLAVLTDRFRHIERLFALLGLASCAFWLIYALRDSLPPPLAHLAATLGTKRVGELVLAQHGCFFALGGMIWLVSAKRITAWRLGLCVPFALACIYQIGVKAGEASAWMHVSIAASGAIAVWLVAMALLLLSLRLNAAAHRLLKGRTRWVRRAGLATYPLYLLHDVIGAALMSRLVIHAIDPFAAFAMALVGVIGLALLAERLEKRLRAVILARTIRLEAAIVDRFPILGRVAMAVSA